MKGWVELVTAPDQLTAEMWKGLLVSNRIPSTLRPEDTISFLGISNRPCTVLVPEDKFEEAKALLIEERLMSEDSA